MYKFHLKDTSFHLSNTKLILISGFKSGYFSNIEWVAMATHYEEAEVSSPSRFPPHTETRLPKRKTNMAPCVNEGNICNSSLPIVQQLPLPNFGNRYIFPCQTYYTKINVKSVKTNRAELP